MPTPFILCDFASPTFFTFNTERCTVEVHRLRHSALRNRGTTLTTPSRAATIAATALRRTPLRSASSRASFRNVPAAGIAPLTPARGGDEVPNASVLDSILYGNRISMPESTTASYESIHSGARIAKGPRGVGFEKRA